MVLVNLDQHSVDWHKWRQDGIGGSEAAVVMGCGFGTQRDLRAVKRGDLVVEENEAMARGTRLEPKARIAYEELTGIRMRPVCVQHETIPWLRASLDGLSEDNDLILEIKCPTKMGGHIKALMGNIPDYYFPQVQHQLAASGLEICHYWSFWDAAEDEEERLAAFKPRDRFKLLPIYRDEAYIKKMLEKERKFFEKMREMPKSRKKSRP